MMSMDNHYIWMILIVALTALLLIYKHLTRKLDYWKKRNIPYIPPLPLVGSFKNVVMFKTSFTESHREFYNMSDKPYAGIYFFDEPYLMIRSPELVKSILVTDFNHFRDKSVFVPSHDTIQANLLFWQPNRLGWKTVRSKVSPFFTSGKLKAMFLLIEKIGVDLVKYINEGCLGKITEAKELSAKYSTEVIAKCAFGVDANCFKYNNAEFREVSRSMFAFTFVRGVSQMSYFFFHSLAKLFRMSFYGVKNINFMKNILKTVIKEREKSGIKVNDIIDFIVQYQKQNLKEFEGDKLYAQPINLFIGGFETTSTTISMVLYELCLNNTIQNKVRSEILESIQEYGGITYEAICSMKYLDMCIAEVLRKYPIVAFSDRLCTNDYKIPGTNDVIEKGTPIYMPMLGFHYDEKYFPEPEKYIPERFEDMSKINKDGIYYFPFGEGPRKCIGKRFGMLSTKTALAHILSTFQVEKNEKTPEKIKFRITSLVLQSEGGIPITFKSLNNF